MDFIFGTKRGARGIIFNADPFNEEAGFRVHTPFASAGREIHEESGEEQYAVQPS